jgi:hypothetical protein
MISSDARLQLRIDACFGATTLRERYPLCAVCGLTCVKRAQTALAAAQVPGARADAAPAGA